MVTCPVFEQAHNRRLLKTNCTIMIMEILCREPAVTRYNDDFMQRLTHLLDHDTVLAPHDVAVNLGLDGKLVIYWARRPNRGQEQRLRKIMDQVHEEFAGKGA
jgi:hypothetical protein